MQSSDTIVLKLPCFSNTFSAATIFFDKLQIRVNCVNPTVVLTAMGKLAWSDPEKGAPMKNQIPQGRFAGITTH